MNSTEFYLIMGMFILASLSMRITLFSLKQSREQHEKARKKIQERKINSLYGRED